MAKALFHKSQRVFVKPVGTWALVERVVPHWVKDVDEPLRVTYECGLGRQFQASELVSEAAMRAHDVAEDDEDDLLLEQWHIVRKLAKWRADLSGADNTNLGTYPVVVTDEGEWGGWRVQGTEYDRDPQRVEHHARMIVHTPDLMRLARRIAEYASQAPGETPEELKAIATRCASILRQVYLQDDDLVDRSATVAAE